MSIFFLPFSNTEQLDVVRALMKVSFIEYDEKNQMERLEDMLKDGYSLIREELEYLEEMIKKYGIYA